MRVRDSNKKPERYEERLLRTRAEELSTVQELEDKREAIRHRPYKIDEQGYHYSSDQLAAIEEIDQILRDRRESKE